VTFRCEVETDVEGTFVSKPFLLSVDLYHVEATNEQIKDTKNIIE